MLIAVLFVEHEREIMPEKPLRALCACRTYSPVKRGSNRKEMSHGAASVRAKKSRRIQRTLRPLLLMFYLRSVQDDHVINHTQIASAYVINKHASARFDRGLDDSS